MSDDPLQFASLIKGGTDSTGPVHDVRMKGFQNRCTVGEAMVTALEGLEPGPSEQVPLDECGGRLVLAHAVVSPVNVPTFARSSMDGFAVKAEDTFGATPYDPIPLKLMGQVLPGAAEVPGVGRGQTVRIMTGAPVPDGADAVLRAEDAQEIEQGSTTMVQVRASVTPGKHIGRSGEDIEAGEEVLPQHRWIRPQDVGLLASMGQRRVKVVRQPRVRIVITGDELLPAPGSNPHRILDSNTPMLTQLVRRDGGRVEQSLALPDDPDAIRPALRCDEVDVLITAGGSSVGREDWLPVLVRESGELPVHGIAMRPSAPTGIGQIGRTRVFLLPGNPVSCLAGYDFFAGPAIRRLAGLPVEWPYRSATLPLARRISSEIGRVDYARVSINANQAVEPITLSGASVLSSTTRADGFVVVAAESEGFAEGESVEVFLYDPWGGRL